MAAGPGPCWRAPMPHCFAERSNAVKCSELGTESVGACQLAPALLSRSSQQHSDCGRSTSIINNLIKLHPTSYRLAPCGASSTQAEPALD